MDETNHERQDEDFVMVSALEHYSYCPRQCALIHREQTFDENLYTLRGRAAHERVEEETSSTEEGGHVERALPLWSERLGLFGKADLVEFHGEVPYPVEYKHGPVSGGRHADLQLCAQALCLEEMTGQTVPRGAVYQVTSRRRREVTFTPQLRELVSKTVLAIRAMLRETELPPPLAGRRCKKCSLKESCLPEVIAGRRRAKILYARLFVPEDPP